MNGLLILAQQSGCLEEPWAVKGVGGYSRDGDIVVERGSSVLPSLSKRPTSQGVYVHKQEKIA